MCAAQLANTYLVADYYACAVLKRDAAWTAPNLLMTEIGFEGSVTIREPIHGGSIGWHQATGMAKLAKLR
jgi:hypothetical protein